MGCGVKSWCHHPTITLQQPLDFPGVARSTKGTGKVVSTRALIAFGDVGTDTIPESEAINVMFNHVRMLQRHPRGSFLRRVGIHMHRASTQMTGAKRRSTEPNLFKNPHGHPGLWGVHCRIFAISSDLQETSRLFASS